MYGTGSAYDKFITYFNVVRAFDLLAYRNYIDILLILLLVTSAVILSSKVNIDVDILVFIKGLAKYAIGFVPFLLELILSKLIDDLGSTLTVLESLVAKLDRKLIQ